MIPAYYLANRSGIPRIESIGVNVTSTEVTYEFRRHEFSDIAFKGLLIVYLDALPVGITGTLPVKFGTYNLKGLNSANITAADLGSSGIYLVYYDSTRGLLQLLSGYAIS